MDDASEDDGTDPGPGGDGTTGREADPEAADPKAPTDPEGAAGPTGDAGPEELSAAADSLREAAEDLLDHLDRWETGEVEDERRADSVEELLDGLDKWDTSDDPTGADDATGADAPDSVDAPGDGSGATDDPE